MIATPVELCGAALFAAAMVTDVRQRRIPNEIVLALCALAGLEWLASGDLAGAATAAAAALAALLAGFALFAARIVGAGDAKLLAVAFAWVGVDDLRIYLAAFAVLTLALATGSLLARRARLAVLARPDPAAQAMENTVPFAVSIGGGAIVTLLAL